MNLKILNNYDTIIFDCDGVLIDVNLFKCEAFGKSVEEYPHQVVSNFVNHCKKTFGISRYVKFKEFFEFANEPFDDNKYNIFLNRYANFCREVYNEADLTPSVERILSFLKNSEQKLFVASGSDEKELISVFERRDLKKYFTEIYGSPKKKSECVSIILKEHPSDKVVFIGDAISDLNTAKEYNLDFIYMNKYTVQSKEQDEVCRRYAKLVINTLEDLVQ